MDRNGTKEVLNENTAADFCYYCHNPVVLSGRLSGALAPSKIVPFKYSKEEAIKPVMEITETAEDGSTMIRKRSTPGSIAFVPSVVGLIIASEVIKDIAKKCEK